MKQFCFAAIAFLAFSVSACEQVSIEDEQDSDLAFTQETLASIESSIEFQEYLRIREFVETKSGEPDPVTGGTTTAATLDKGSILLQLEDDVSNEEFQTLLQQRRLQLINIYPEAGVVHVAADLSSYFSSASGDRNSIEYSLLVADTIREDFEAEDAVRTATPDVALSIETEPLRLLPSSVFESAQSSSGEITDWGIGDLEVVDLWDEEAARDGVIVGFLDAGFGRHEDLIFTPPSGNLKRHNHGNHVAGIACAAHNDVGVRGVVPNCFIYANADPFFGYDSSPDQLLDWQATFGQLIADLDETLEEERVRVYNISMGYNWMPNFRINTDDDTELAAQARRLVDGQGEIVLSFYKRAAANDKVVFSAAGNDSYRGDINARYASPFNWAALVGPERGIDVSAAIVQAHDEAGTKADFSNIGGHLSCPGVDVVSAIAFNSSGSPSTGSYGTMSGTSMASPYCAGVHALISILEPEKSSAEILECMINNGSGVVSGAVKVSARAARDACD